MTGDKPKNWVNWLSLAEYWYNTNFHSSIQSTPFEVVYGQPPPLHTPYLAGESVVEAVDRSLQARENTITTLQFHLKRAQDRMKSLADKHRTDRSFDVGMWVYVKLQPHRQVTIRLQKYTKLSAKYYGPFLIVERIGPVAYKLQLPSTSSIHPVFHVSQLKRCKGHDHKIGALPTCNSEGLLSLELVAILDRKLGKLNNKPAVYLLVQWANQSVEDATWELHHDFVLRFLTFHLILEVKDLKGGCIDTS